MFGIQFALQFPHVPRRRQFPQRMIQHQISNRQGHHGSGTVLATDISHDRKQFYQTVQSSTFIAVEVVQSLSRNASAELDVNFPCSLPVFVCRFPVCRQWLEQTSQLLVQITHFPLRHFDLPGSFVTGQWHDQRSSFAAIQNAAHKIPVIHRRLYFAHGTCPTIQHNLPAPGTSRRRPPTA